MSVRTRETASRHPRDLRLHDTRRSLTVSAKLAMCLQPEFDQVSITVLEPAGADSTWTTIGELVTELDRLQHDAGEGPCVDSICSRRCVVAPHLRHEDRWPHYVRAAVALGLRSQVSAPLRSRGGDQVGALNLYSTTHDRLGLTAPLVGEVIASQVADTLVRHGEVEEMHSALDGSTTLGQAAGIVMARLDLDAEHATAYLRRAAMFLDMNLAQHLVRTRELPAMRQA